MQVNVMGADAGKKGKSLDVPDSIFAQPYNEGLIHQIVTAYLAGGRAGTAAQKTRSEVRGGGIKPWRQKGTGRARAGTIRSPLWRTGGVIFAAKPRDYSQKVNRKMYAAAIRSILGELLRQERLILADEFIVKSNKTKDLQNQLDQMKLKDVLIVVDEVTDELRLAARNLKFVSICPVEKINPVCLIEHEHVLMTVASIRKIEERLV